MTERVLVIGAGLAGLTAANALARMGVDVTVFEARDRIGGRVHTVRSSPSNLAIELGPEWFDDHGPVHQLLNAKGVTAEEASGGYRVRLGGIWRDMGELVSGSAELSRRLDELGGPDRTVASALKECCPDDTLIEAKQRLWRYIEGFHAADPEQLSLQWLKQVEESESAADASTRVPAGLDHVVQLVRDDGGVAFDIRLASEVRRVRWSKGSVELTISSPDGDIVEHGTAAVITLPLGVLSSNSVQFDPLLGKDAAMALLATGPVVKPVLEFTEPFWLSTAPFRDALFVQDPTLPIPTWWTQRPADRPTLTGWVAGPAVGRLPKQSGADYTSIALDSVARILGMPRPDVEAQLRTAHYHDWQGDPHATGAYTWVRADGVEAHAALGAPLDTTLYFAGEATAGNGLNATMDGAILSGRRVAEEYSGHRASR